MAIYKTKGLTKRGKEEVLRGLSKKERIAYIKTLEDYKKGNYTQGLILKKAEERSYNRTKWKKVVRKSNPLILWYRTYYFKRMDIPARQINIMLSKIRDRYEVTVGKPSGAKPTKRTFKLKSSAVRYAKNEMKKRSSKW